MLANGDMVSNLAKGARKARDFELCMGKHDCIPKQVPSMVRRCKGAGFFLYHSRSRGEAPGP